MITVEIFQPNNPDDLRVHKWRKLVCFNGKCEKLLRDTDTQHAASERVVRPYAVMEGSTYCLEHFYEELFRLTGQPVTSILDIGERIRPGSDRLPEDP